MRADQEGPNTADDELLGETLVVEGALGREDLDRARARQRALLAEGVTLRLSEILVREGLVPSERIDALSARAVRGEADSTGPPRPFGRYELQEVLGRGGMGVVWKAWDGDLKRTVALKLVHGERVADPERIERFQREARATARLGHPAIVKVFDVGVQDGQQYLTTEFVEGRSLAAAAREGLPRRKLLAAVLEVARALQFAHDRGVVHRDVKPANILVDRGGRPHVVDFGLAKEVFAGAREGLTASGALLGTPQYMSPEQAEGRPGAVGPASDQYSLGVVLYEVLTGRLPFQGESIRELFLEIWQKEPPPPRRIDPRIAPELESICLKALAKTPAERYPTMGAFADDLARYLRGEQTSVRPVGRTGRFFRRGKGRSRLVFSLAGGAVLAASVSAWAIFAADEDSEGDAGAAGPLAGDAPEAQDGRDEALALVEGARPALDRYSEGLYDDRSDIAHLIAGVEEAARSFAAALQKDPDLAGAHHLLGRAREVMGSLGSTEESYRQAIRLDPELAAARLDLGRLLLARAFLETTSLSQEAAMGTFARASALADESADLIDGAAGTGRGDSILREVARAMQAYARSDPASARRIARAALEIHDGAPGSEDLHWVLGLALSETAEQLSELDRAVAAGPHLPIVRLSRSIVRSRAGDRDGALADVDAAIRARPGFTAAYISRAGIRLDAGDLEGAFADYSLAIRIDPGIGAAYVNRSVVRRQKGDPDGAMADCLEALRVDPDCVDAHIQHGVLLREKGELDPAIAAYGRALGIDPFAVRALNNRGNARREAGDLGGARADYDEAIRIDPTYVEPYLQRASLLDEMGDLNGAFSDYTEAIRLRPRSAIARINRGLVRANLGDFRGALDDYDVAISIEPRSAEAYLDRGSAFQSLGELDLAIEDYGRAIACDPSFKEAFYNRGLARRQAGDLPRAISDYTEALRIAPGFRSARISRSAAYLLAGDPDAAIADCDAVLAADPGDPAAYANRGAGREAKGDLAGAAADYERGLEVAPPGWPEREKLERALARVRGGG
ncbi:MAG: tetratricopeptide repeat protein [Planctomycetes bacterium]|nr:tetratricopeptide repeat protein [Planctomycetota bacterium]